MWPATNDMQVSLNMLCNREMASDGRHKDKNSIIQNNIMVAKTQQKAVPNITNRHLNRRKE